MLRQIVKNLLHITILFCSLSVQAITVTTPQMILSPRPINITQNADASVFGQPMDSATTASIDNVFSCSNIFYLCTSASVKLDSSIQPSGITVTMGGITYGVYESGVPGVGFIIGVKDTKSSTFIPLTDKETLTWSGLINQIGFNVQVYFIKTNSRLVTGTITTPEISAAIMTGYESGSGYSATSKIIIKPTTINISANGCDVDQSILNFPMGDISEREFKGVGSHSAGVSATVSLNCDANVTVGMVLTDQSDTTNTGNILSLTSDSQAKGIGVQFFLDGGSNPLYLGPDSSLKGTTGQVILVKTQVGDTTVSVPLTAKYVQTGDITVGNANALASLTFSYQ
ncbi:type 1 fimbria pilin [Serratia fonticola]|jgi:type 1 fimbria pilin|uniref:Type 1 fimbria pilin n=1 Tax=Serratia fonticola TaxID=47917 RepID=A0A542CVM5_SERFO|nr:fimbrial protein [Serratia fonticola]TQI78142.1 type 1 fimbria pilin [Serratia fonticola]TQI94860.1 type 1 fimbria pilin [Serratia fonticola]TVZ69358.1 type 1 fimbria pilin [Serratia fonticola]